MGDSLAVVDLGGDQRATAVAAGYFHTCALLYTGDVKCWGKFNFLVALAVFKLILALVPTTSDDDVDGDGSDGGHQNMADLCHIH